MKTSMIIFCLAMACGTGGETLDPAAQNSAELTAREALRKHADLFHEILAKHGGDANEELVLGEPLDIYVVRLDELAAFDGAVAPLLHDTARRLFPLHGRSGAVLTSLTVVRSGNGWTMARAGSKNLTTELVAVRAALGGEAKDVKLVRVPGLNVDLLASTNGGATLLTPLSDHEELGLRAHRPQSATEMLAQLIPGAKKALVDHF